VRLTFFRNVVAGAKWLVRGRLAPVPLPLVPPMLASSGIIPGAPAGWSYEVEWDGWRAVVYVDGGGVQVRTRRGREVADSLPELAGLVDARICPAGGSGRG
jgi:ATP-dependent DNA ligase